MRFAALLYILFAGVAMGDDKKSPAALTPKQITDGWLMLFDGESTFGLTVVGVGESEAVVKVR